MIAGTVVLIVSVFVAFSYLESPEALFRQMQRIFFYIAPPFAAVFTMGLLWRRANGTAAVVTIVSGFLFLLLLEHGIRFSIPHLLTVDLSPPLWDAIPWLTPYRRAYQHSALLIGRCA